MQYNQLPIDVTLLFGSPHGSHHIFKLDIDFVDDQAKVYAEIDKKNIQKEVGQKVALIFDFEVDPGRQQQAVQYFYKSESQSKSPLQILFKNRPNQHDSECQFSIHKNEASIRIIYKVIADEDQQVFKNFNEIFDIFATSGVHLESHISLLLKGELSHSNKNRTNVLVNYSQFNYTSNSFCAENFFTALQQFDQIKLNCSYYLKHPFYELVKKSKTAKIRLKMDDIRKISRYYDRVIEKKKQSSQKQYQYKGDGLFRKSTYALIVYRNRYMIKIRGEYESQDAFLRLVKVYAKFLERLFREQFYKE